MVYQWLISKKTILFGSTFSRGPYGKAVFVRISDENAVGKVSTNFAAAKNGKVGSNFSAAKNGQVSSNSKKR